MEVVRLHYILVSCLVYMIELSDSIRVPLSLASEDGILREENTSKPQWLYDVNPDEEFGA